MSKQLGSKTANNLYILFTISIKLYFQTTFVLQKPSNIHNKQLLDEVEQNIVICQKRADSLFAEAEGCSEQLFAR